MDKLPPQLVARLQSLRGQGKTDLTDDERERLRRTVAGITKQQPKLRLVKDKRSRPMKCDSCKQEFSQADMVPDILGDNGFVCRGCKQELEAGYEAWLTSMGLGSRQQAVWEILCCHYLQSCGWNLTPPDVDEQKDRLLAQVDAEIVADKEKLDKEYPWRLYLTEKMCFRPDKRRTRAIIAKLNEMAADNKDDGPEYRTFGEIEQGEFDFAERPALSSAVFLLQELLDFNDSLS